MAEAPLQASLVALQCSCHVRKCYIRSVKLTPLQSKSWLEGQILPTCICVHSVSICNSIFLSFYIGECTRIHQTISIHHKVYERIQGLIKYSYMCFVTPLTTCKIMSCVCSRWWGEHPAQQWCVSLLIFLSSISFTTLHIWCWASVTCGFHRAFCRLVFSGGRCHWL
jgi:hypothetical protein